MTELQLIGLELRSKSEQLRVFLSGGQCKNFEDYKFGSGQILGLEYAQEVVKGIKQRQEEAQDE